MMYLFTRRIVAQDKVETGLQVRRAIHDLLKGCDCVLKLPQAHERIADVAHDLVPDA